jgi:hypothetical protein
MYYVDEFFGYINSNDLKSIKVSQHLEDASKYNDIKEIEFVASSIELDFSRRLLDVQFLNICGEMFDDFNKNNFKFIIENLEEIRKNKILSILEY